MSKLIDGLAKRLVEREEVPRRDFLTGRRAAAATVVPLVGAVAEVTGEAAQAQAAARPSKPPPLPKRSDLRAIHIALMGVDARLKSELVALVDALKTPAHDGTFSTAADDALARIRTTVRKLHGAIKNVQPDSTERSKMLAGLADYEQVLADLEQLGQTTDKKQAADLAAKIKKLGNRATANYGAVHAALNLPKAP